MRETDYDLLIIGGGAAGMMAAISARETYPNYKIAIIDRTFALGRKILVCGAGRCNITNKNLKSQINKRYYGARTPYIKSIFNQFGYKDIVFFFNELGVELYVERKTDIGKLFPVTNQAKTITTLLLDELKRNEISIILNTECRLISKEKNQFLLDTLNLDSRESTTFTSNKLILSAGGKTYPALGSNGSGYSLAESLGHSIIKPVPSALPLESDNPLSKKLQGVRADIEVTSIINGKDIKTRVDEVMFTKYGVSGPAILNISREISIELNRNKNNNIFVNLNFFPGKDRPKVKETLSSRWKRRPTQTLEASLIGLFANKIAPAIIQEAKLNPEKIGSALSEAEIERLIDTLYSYKIKIHNTRTWNEAEFTAGGVNTKETFATTLESKIVKDLYLCGEILDVDGDVGGFNLSWAWSSGYVAGKLQ